MIAVPMIIPTNIARTILEVRLNLGSLFVMGSSVIFDFVMLLCAQMILDQTNAEF